MKRFLISILFLAVGLSLGFVVSFSFVLPFRILSPGMMYQRIINHRDFAIKKSIARGEYNCCIEPACTMCYMEPNRWNNKTAGRCDCVEFIAKGEDPCPQCKRGLAGNKDNVCSLEEDCN